jgi:hypothetical protein
MKTLTNITRVALREVFRASKQGSFPVLIRGDQRITLRGFRAVGDEFGVDTICLTNQQKERMPLEEGDTIEYSD